ncbi:hypothetical protein Tco_0489924 [Tanacetum coccineum]
MLPHHTITTEPMLEVIYDKDKSDKRFMAMDEIMKFSTGTLRLVNSGIRQRLIDNNFNRVNRRLIKVADLGRMKLQYLHA